MEQIDLLLLEIEEKMEKSVHSLENEFNQIRTGRANPNLLDRIMVSYYGVLTPLKQLASIQIPEATQLYIKPFDPSTLKDIEAAINTSGLDLPPHNDGNGIRLMLPSLTEERRKSLVKDVEKLAEAGKVSIRNIRRDGNDQVKKLSLPEDNERIYLDDIQNLTNKYTELVDEKTKLKTNDLLNI
ncbi:MAG: ribosome recycling factor [Acholeplasmataceae bacterium]